MPESSPRETNLALPGRGETILPGISLGNVPVSGTFGLRGQVEEDASLSGVSAARSVLVLRYTCFSSEGDESTAIEEAGECPELTSAQSVDRLFLGADTVASADAQGAFEVRGLAPGEVHLLGVSFALQEDGSLGEVLGMSDPLPHLGSPSVDGDVVDEVAEAIQIKPLPDARTPVQVALLPEQREASLILVPAGQEAPPCSDGLADGEAFPAPFSYARHFSLEPAGNSEPGKLFFKKHFSCQRFWNWKQGNCFGK